MSMACTITSRTAKLAVPTDKVRYVTHSCPNMQQAEAAFQGYTWYDKANTLALELRSFRLLNKACLLRGTNAPCNGSDAAASEPHGHHGKRLCTVHQVEQLKSAIRVLDMNQMDQLE